MSTAEPNPIAPASGRLWKGCFGALFAIGLAAFVAGISGEAAQRVWQAYLVNFLFWAGLSFGAVLFTAVLNMAEAQWGRPVKRLAEGFGAYLPVSFLLFWLLYFGREEIFPWVRTPIAQKQFWLNAPFLFARNGAALLLLTGLSLALVYHSVRADREWLANRAGAAPDDLPGPWTARWRTQKILSPILGIAYAIVLSLLAFDLIMALDPEWHSTLFGAYYFMGSFYTAIAAIFLVAFLGRERLNLAEAIGSRQFHDLGKLTLAFAVFTGYLFFAQFLVIWYGNLPEETRFVILRVKLSPWRPLAWAILGMVLVIPFVVLLNRKVKIKKGPMIALASVILAGMWLERFILVAPSIWKGEGIPLGPLEILITAGFLGLVGLSLILFLERVPPLPVSDPLFRKWVESGDETLRP